MENKIVIVTEKEIEINENAKIYENFKRIYSFKNSITIIKIGEKDMKLFDELDLQMLFKLFKSAKKQCVDSLYMPISFKNIIHDRFREYESIIKYNM